MFTFCSRNSLVILNRSISIIRDILGSCFFTVAIFFVRSVPYGLFLYIQFFCLSTVNYQDIFMEPIVLLLVRSKQATIILPAVVIVEEITVVTLLQKAYDNLRVLFVKYTGFMGGACMNSYGSGLLVYSYKNNKNIDNGLST
uniref:Uncharacterized protein n=1 Tax=Triticum urartu TaxID=4572 RepID=A0A8R7PMX6_TRIUA